MLEDRKLTNKMIQFGEGNFLRAFVDWQINKMNHENKDNFGVVIVQPRANGMINVLEKQNNKYHLLLRGILNKEVVDEQIFIDCITKCINPYSDFASFIDLAKEDEIEFITSNTTEAGIYFSKDEPYLDCVPESYAAKLCLLLHARYEYSNHALDKGYKILPCELIDKNGDKLKAVVLEYASLYQFEDGFKQWINAACSFHNTLVDRIVPGFPKNDIEAITKQIGYQDDLVVVAEPYNLWVIEGNEDNFTNLKIKTAGVNTIFVEDLEIYRTRKVLVLNGLHTSMAIIGMLLDKKRVIDVINDPVLNQLFHKLAYQEIGICINQNDINNYIDNIFERFENPYIEHFLSSIILNTVSKYLTRNAPVLDNYYACKKTLPPITTFTFACLLSLYQSGNDQLNDDQKHFDFINECFENNSVIDAICKIVISKKIINIKAEYQERFINEVIKYYELINEDLTSCIELLIKEG